ncbi:hypothetical protein IH992_19145 [Candidatus Poribacteria bacterium]|nr:hypothetical protein [Candidatus Poribacteria bacterium]
MCSRQRKTVKQELSPNTLIADGENRNDRLQDPLGPFGKWQADHISELMALCERKRLDVILPDVGAMGFTAWSNVMPRLIAIGAQGSPHAWIEPFKSWYAAQIGCAYGNVPTAPMRGFFMPETLCVKSSFYRNKTQCKMR